LAKDFLIPFTYTIPKEKKRDRNIMLETFRNELPGIFNWAIKGLLEYDRIGLNPPDTVLNATQEYKTDSNNFISFLNEKTIHKKGNNSVSVTTKELYESYNNWCMIESEQNLFKSSRAMIAFLRTKLKKS